MRGSWVGSSSCVVGLGGGEGGGKGVGVEVGIVVYAVCVCVCVCVRRDGRGFVFFIAETGCS